MIISLKAAAAPSTSRLVASRHSNASWIALDLNGCKWLMLDFIPMLVKIICNLIQPLKFVIGYILFGLKSKHRVIDV